MISCLYQQWLSNAQFIPEYLKDRWDEIMIFYGDFLSEIDDDKDYSIKGIYYDDNFIKMIMTTIRSTALCSF